jgi:hypothetical protein
VPVLPTVRIPVFGAGCNRERESHVGKTPDSRLAY